MPACPVLFWKCPVNSCVINLSFEDFYDRMHLLRMEKCIDDASVAASNYI